MRRSLPLAGLLFCALALTVSADDGRPIGTKIGYIQYFNNSGKNIRLVSSSKWGVIDSSMRPNQTIRVAFIINDHPRVLTAYDSKTGAVVANRVLHLRDEHEYDVDFSPAPVTMEKDGKTYMSIPADRGKPVKNKAASPPVQEKPSNP